MKGFIMRLPNATAPHPPAPPVELSQCELPLPPEPIVPVRPAPPASCYDDSKPNVTQTIRGTTLATLEQNRQLARYYLYEDNEVHPYLSFGDLPVVLRQGQSANMLVAGTSGAGKSTLLKMLLSQLLPLTFSQARRLVEQSPDIYKRRFSSPHEWSRSFTHQAVVYNAKDEYVPFLKGFGFHEDRDLFILDLSDPRCYAWDLARDLRDRDTIKAFSSHFVPRPPESVGDENSKFWLKQARQLIEAVIISFVNAARAANEEPRWTLRDLVNAFDSQETFANILGQHHDKPEAMIAQFLSVAPNQRDSTYTTVGQYVRTFSDAAAYWEEASRRGRSISLKEWAISGSHTVLVLPDTQRKEELYEPLNNMLLEAVTSLILKQEYSFYVDEDGRRRTRKRFFFFDELGSAGRLAALKRLLTVGREFDAHVLLGLHQWSHVEETYGEKRAKTILGLCSYKAFLRADDPDTAEWMSKRIGERQWNHQKESYTYGVRDGKTFVRTSSQQKGRSVGMQETDTQSDAFSTQDTHSRNSSTTRGNGRRTTSGVADSHSEGHSTQTAHSRGITLQDTENTTEGTNEGTSQDKSESRTYSSELRQDYAVLASEIMNLSDPSTSQEVGGFFLVPPLPTWRADIPFDRLRPHLENPDALISTPPLLEWENDWIVGQLTSWTEEDYKRLHIQSPMLGHLTVSSSPPSLPLFANGASEPGMKKRRKSVRPRPNTGKLADDFSF
jgi:energy-coupling factor transporter ATP-binding protein EcfA2